MGFIAPAWKWFIVVLPVKINCLPGTKNCRPEVSGCGYLFFK